MSRQRINLTVDQRTVTIRGWRGGDIAREAGLKPIYIGRLKGWVVDAGRLPDLVAYAELRNLAVSIAEVAT